MYKNKKLIGIETKERQKNIKITREQQEHKQRLLKTFKVKKVKKTDYKRIN
jgi:hypothetical protein